MADDFGERADDDAAAADDVEDGVLGARVGELDDLPQRLLVHDPGGGRERSAWRLN
ncbi:MAG: hypothetical protein Q7W02_26305 [Candidatus Rokubacteria bacterium]|nr:hypothetical protein [Candidatus Rokubacteria bacterium]